MTVIDGRSVGNAQGAGGALRLGAFSRAARTAGALVLYALAVVAAVALVTTATAQADGCPNAEVRAQQGSAALPDCRAYEQVTPPGKDSGEPLGALTTHSAEREQWGASGARAAIGGARFAWWSEYALPEDSLAQPYAPGVSGLQDLSTRTSGGWSSENVVPPQSTEYGLGCQQLVGMVGWSADLERGILADGIAQESALSPGGPFANQKLECGHEEPRLGAVQPPGFEEREGFQNLFLREDETGAYRLLNATPEGAPHPRPSYEGQEYFPASFLAGSSDLSHVVFEEELPLTEAAERTSPAVEEACEKSEPGCWEGRDNLYEWSEGAPGAAGSVQLVTVLPDGSPVEGALAGATRNNGGGGDVTRPGKIPTLQLSPNVAAFRHAVSADGSRVFFETGSGLYVREDGTTTVRIDAAQSGLPGAGDGGGSFMAAGADGTKVYFTADASHLLTGDTVPGSGVNLYQCALPRNDGGACTLTDLTPAPEAGVLGVAGTNEGTRAEEEGGSPYVYFVAKGVLTGAVGAVPGQPNLYLRHGGSTAYVATLAGGEEGTSPEGTPCTKNTQFSCHVTEGDSCDWTERGGCDFTYENEELQSVAGGLTSRVSANGRYLAFNSIRSLTGYNNEDAASQLPGEKTDAEIFVYDAVAGTLRCASCNPDPNVRPTAPATIRWPATPNGNGYQHALYPQRNLSDNGQLFFESYDPLLPADTGGALSVYEYDAGSGAPALISNGASDTESVFLDATPSGSDVFFMTADKLVGGDEDSSFDVYDARVGGGFPEARQAAAACEDEAHCRAAATAPRPVPAPGTASFSGPGNVRQAPAAHHKKRKHHRKHRHRKHHRHRHRSGSQHGRPWAGTLPADGTSTGATTSSPESADEAPVEPSTAPIVVTEGAERVEVESAVLFGKVYREIVFNSPKCVALGLVCHNSAGSKITACAFEFAPAAYYESHAGSYDGQAACEPPPPYPETDQVEVVKAALAGLEPHTVYHFRLTATNELGQTGAGADMTFMTEGTYGPPTVDSEGYELSHQGDGTFSAQLSARINPHGYETTCGAQFVSDAQFQQSGFAAATDLSCTPSQLPVGFRGEEVTATASGLQPGGRYHFRFLAENEKGPVAGPEQTFLTFAVEGFEAGPSDLQAGGHPAALTERFQLSTATESPWGAAFPRFAIVNPRSIVTNLPPGLVGNPLATPRCAQQELINATCSGAAQVGVLRIEGNRRQEGDGPYVLPLYNLVPPFGVAAQLGAPLPPPVHGAAHIDAGLGTASGYGIEAAALNTTAAEGLISVDATIWGVPHDPGHDAERICPMPGHAEEPAAKGGECPSDSELEADLRPFLRNPTSCTEVPTATVAVDAWQAPGDAVEASSESPPMEGCDEVPFEPSFALAPTATSADSPTGLHVSLHLPQPESAGGVGEADLRKAVITLPQGLQINAASADGLAACTPAQIELAGPEPARCPDASKIGTVAISTPLLERPLRGGVYVAGPYDNPFHSLLALYIAVDDPRTGVVVKLAGEVEADHTTGQLTTTFDQSPQLPFEDFELEFFAGPRAALKTPVTCGSFETAAALTPWTAPEGEVASRDSAFQIGSGAGGSACAGSPEAAPNAPAFSAGTLSPQAGAYSPFVMHLSRADGSQEIEGVSVTLPPGLTGRLAGVPYCPDAAIRRAATRDGRAEVANPDCPAASRVGTVTVAAGAGSSPYEVSGDAYLAGPYRGAPLSLAVVTPAVAGPFDLGTVVVRAALYVDPETARIHAVAGPIPSMLQGIPLDVRSIALQLDRPQFSLNPTSCEPTAVAGTALSTLGQGAALGDRFQVGGCEGLPFAPQLALSLGGGTRRGAHPALKAVLRTQPGEANIAGAQVTLPHSEFLDQSHLQNICTRVQFSEGAGNGAGCPPSSVYGFARAETPLLDQPLEGPVYLRSSSHQLPDLVAALGGQIDVVLDSRVDSANERLRSTFEAVPDAPVSEFTLEMEGGANGLLVNSTDICAGSRVRRAVADFSGQNGKIFQARPKLQVSCKKKSGKKRKKRKKRRGFGAQSSPKRRERSRLQSEGGRG